MDPTAENYVEEATVQTDPALCRWKIQGCTIPGTPNYKGGRTMGCNPATQPADEPCGATYMSREDINNNICGEFGCTDPTKLHYSAAATHDPSLCYSESGQHLGKCCRDGFHGCTTALALNGPKGDCAKANCGGTEAIEKPDLSSRACITDKERQALKCVNIDDNSCEFEVRGCSGRVERNLARWSWLC